MVLVLKRKRRRPELSNNISLEFDPEVVFRNTTPQLRATNINQILGEPKHIKSPKTPKPPKNLPPVSSPESGVPGVKEKEKDNILAELLLPRLHPAQQEIKINAERFNVLCCGRRFGKDILGEDRIIETALEGYPTAWYSPGYRSLAEVWRSLKIKLQPALKHVSEQEKRIELITGGIIEFWSLEDDVEASRGRKYKRIIVNEAAKIKKLEVAWKEVILSTLLDFNGDAWFLSTPRGRNYFHTLFTYGEPYLRDGITPNPLKDPSYISWQKPTEANPYMTREGIEHLRKLVGPRVAAQEVDAVFLETSGRFFDEYIRSEHGEISPHEIYSFDVPKYWPKKGGFDWGKANPCCFGLFATDEDANELLIDEVYEAGLSNEQQADKILQCLERNKLDKKDVVIWSDPSIFPPKDETKRVGRYTVEDFWAKGLRMVPANNDRVNGWTRIKELMRRRGKKTQVAGFRVFKDKCLNFCKTIPILESDEKNIEDLDTNMEDHAADMARYGIQRSIKSGGDPDNPPPRKPDPTENYPLWAKSNSEYLA